MGRNDVVKADGSIDYDYIGESIDNLNNAVEGLGSQTADLVYETAGGTATAITLTTGALVNGYAKTFIASQNNNGTETTINGKKLYKPNTTNAPTLVVGKAYTIWYSASGGCFFIKASAEGDAQPSDVLAGKTFSNSNDTGLVGSMDLSNLAAGNIKDGVNINGIVGSLGLKVASLDLGSTSYSANSGGSSKTYTQQLNVNFTPKILLITSQAMPYISGDYYTLYPGVFSYPSSGIYLNTSLKRSAVNYLTLDGSFSTSGNTCTVSFTISGTNDNSSAASINYVKIYLLGL